MEYPAWVTYVFILTLCCLSGLFSGLTLGLLGLDPIGLEVIASGDNDRLAWCAEKILPLRKKGNLLLCTLLLGNVVWVLVVAEP